MSVHEPLTIAISRQVGSGGAWVGQAVARRLGIPYFDRELLALAARELGVDERVVKRLEERRRSAWSVLGAAAGFGSPDGLYVAAPVQVVNELDVLEVERELIEKIAGQGDAVIVGRGASWVLRGRRGLVSVLLHAPDDWRIQRIMQTYGLAEVKAATDFVRQSDRQRKAFLESLGGPAASDCQRYDCCLDTAAAGLDTAVNVVVELAASRLRSLREDCRA